MTPGTETELLTGYVVTPQWLYEHLDDPALRIVDVRLIESYVDGHIPGAVPVDLNAVRGRRDGIDAMLIEPDAFAAVASRLGIGAGTRVVIYDDHHGLTASRIAWSLLAYGHTLVALLDGGWDAWEASSYPVAADTQTPSPTVFTAQPDASVLADIEQVRAAQGTDTVVLDVRAPAEYERGHVPGAVLWNWENGTSDDHTFLTADDVLPALESLGVTPDREIITYCQAGVRAAHTFLLLRQLGFEQVRMYDGSWLEWSQREGIEGH